MMKIVPRTALSEFEFPEVGTASATLVSGFSNVSNISPSSIINFSLQPNSWQVSCSTTALPLVNSQIGTYVMSDILDLVPESELNDKINFYEDKYSLPSQAFYKKWINGEFEDTPEANEWANLWALLRSFKDVGIVSR